MLNVKTKRRTIWWSGMKRLVHNTECDAKRRWRKGIDLDSDVTRSLVHPFRSPLIIQAELESRQVYKKNVKYLDNISIKLNDDNYANDQLGTL